MMIYSRTASAHPARRLALLLATASLVPAAALAQTPAPVAATASEAGLDDIIVTANRSGAESLQDVALAVSVVNIEQVTRSGQGNLVDIQRFTPSLSITEGGPGFNKFNMRGLSTGGYATSDTSDRSLVAVYLDDTPISLQGQTPDLRVYDLERVEVLRGPQGTLYGAGSMAGTIRFVTAKPDSTKAFGYAEGGLATTQHGEGSYNLRGMVNLPLITDKLALRGNFYLGQDGGFIDNIGVRDKDNANRNRTAQARVAARWTPVEDLTIDASFTYEWSRARGLNAVYSDLPKYTISTNGPEGTSDKFRLYQIGADYDLGFAHFIATAAYTDRNIGFKLSPEGSIGYFFQDYGSGLPIGAGSYPLFTAPTSYSQEIAELIPAELYRIDNKVKDYMVEARLVSNNDGPVRWTVGVFYEKQKRRLVQDIPTPGFDKLSYMNYFYGPDNPVNPTNYNTPDGRYDSQLVDQAPSSDDIYYGLQNLNEHQIAVYADGTWSVTDRLDLTAGLRYFDFKEKYSIFSSGVYGVVNNTPLVLNATLKANGVNPRANISYDVSDDFMIYAEAAKGFRYGGGNQPVPLGSAGIAGQCTRNLAAYGYDSAPLTFGPDKLWSYTVGEKAKLADGRITVNASAYYIDWTDVQTRLRLDCSYFFTDNQGKIESKGLELETVFKISPSLTISAGGSYNDSTANGDIPTVGAFDGDRTPFFPKWIANVGVFYDTTLGNGELHLQANYQHQSKQFTTFSRFSTALVGGVLTPTGDSQIYAVIPATNSLNLSAAYEIGNFEVGVYGTNIVNGVKTTSVTTATYYKVYQAGDRLSVARPRTVGIRAKVSF